MRGFRQTMQRTLLHRQCNEPFPWQQAKETARNQLARMYRSSAISEEEILQCMYSIGDNESYLAFSRDPITRMIALLQVGRCLGIIRFFITSIDGSRHPGSMHLAGAPLHSQTSPMRAGSLLKAAIEVHILKCPIGSVADMQSCVEPYNRLSLRRSTLTPTAARMWKARWQYPWAAAVRASATATRSSTPTCCSR